MASPAVRESQTSSWACDARYRGTRRRLTLAPDPSLAAGPDLGPDPGAWPWEQLGEDEPGSKARDELLRSGMRSALLLPALALCLLACSPSPPSGNGTDTDTDTDATPTDTDTGECEPPPGLFADCVAGGTEACEADTLPICISDGSQTLGVCSRGCEDLCDCWAAPDSGTAPVVCRSIVAGDPSQSCVLECSNGETCPDGMVCNELTDSLQICVFQTN